MTKSFFQKVRKLLQIDPVGAMTKAIRWVYYTKVKRYRKYILGDDVRHGVFQVFLKQDGEDFYVVKVPRSDTKYGRNFVRCLESEEGYLDFRETISNLQNLKYIGRHINGVTEISRDGGYVSPIINGYNLAELLAGSVTMDRDKRKRFETSTDELLCRLEHFLRAFGYIHGDWDLQNLIYDDTANRIVNVDLEGFFMYRNGEPETQLSRIQANLARVKHRIAPRAVAHPFRVVPSDRREFVAVSARGDSVLRTRNGPGKPGKRPESGPK